MKRVINLSLIVFTILLSTTVKASDFISVKIENSSTINVSLTNIRKGQKLYLKDYSGTILFNATLDAMPTYRKYFNFSTVKNGVYFVETESEFDIRVTPVVKNTKGVTLINNSAITIFKPKLLINKSLVKVMVTRTEETPLNVSIYDVDGVLVFDEKVVGEEGKFIIERTYDFSKVPSGKYNIHFRLKDRVFIKEINI